MLPLDAYEWSSMEVWTGTPNEVPVLISRWQQHRDAATLSELLWSRLSAEGSFSEAAIAALPHLASRLDVVPAAQQFEICRFVAMTHDEDARGEHLAASHTARRVADELLTTANELSRVTGLLSCLASFSNWTQGREFFSAFVADETELGGVCDRCSSDLVFRFTAAGLGWCSKDGSELRSAAVWKIEPAHDFAAARSASVVEFFKSVCDFPQRQSLTSQFLVFLGTTSCAHCEHSLRVSDVVR